MTKHLLPFLLFVPLALGCPKRLPSPPTETPDAAALLEQVAAAEARVSTLKGDARLVVDTPQGKGSVGLWVAVAKPASVHLEALDFFNRPRAIFSSDGQRFGFHDAQEGRYFTGPVSTRNLARFLPIVVPPEQLIGLLLGQATLLTPADKRSVERDDATGAWRLVLTRGEVSQTVWIHPATHRVLKSETRGLDAYDVTCEDFQQTGSLAFPRRVLLTAPSARTKLELRYTDVTLNEPPDPSVFTPEAPEGVPVTEVNESGQPSPSPSPGS